jgi:minor extracellular serine protease Vpr
MLSRIAFLLLLTVVSSAAGSRLDEYALILGDQPLVESHHARGSAAHRDIRSAQDVLVRHLNQRHVAVTGRVQSLLNAVFVLVPHGQLPDFRSMPGVVRWSYVPRLYPQLNKALDLSNVPAAWANPLIGGMSRAGSGMRIGVIDSGIDQTHPAFQDPSLQAPAGFPRGDVRYTNSKVIVARSYVSLLSSPNPPPDDLTPTDHIGHGTAVAMIAAGERVTAPLGTISGVAPHAFLGNYKIYGSPGVTTGTNGSALVQALEDALTDGMDVVNIASGNSALYAPLDADTMACGSNNGLRPYIPSNACDIAAQAVENAVRSGMVVVVSAGDDGPARGTINTPGTASSAITVGASTNAHNFYSSVSVASAGLPQVDALFGIPKPAARADFNLVDVTSTGNDGLACTPLPANSLNGAVVLVKRGTCAFETKANNIQMAGGTALLIYLDNPAGAVFTPTNLEHTAIPSAVISNSAGVALHSYLKQNPSVTTRVTLDPTLREVAANYDLIPSFSSRGPSIGTAALIKPELVAVGTDRYTSVQGTSFSAALVTGAVALVKQAHPGLSPAQYKSAVVNTASASLLDNGVPARLEAAGAGKLNAASAVSIGATVAPSTLSFNGLLSTVGVPATSTVNLTNITDGAANYSVQVAQADGDPLASIAVTPSSGTLSAHQTVTLSVTLSGTLPAPGSYQGFVRIAGLGPTLSIPYWYIVSDGVVNSLFPVIGDGVSAAVGETKDLIAVRAVDRYGLSVPNTQVAFSALSGGGAINGTPDPATDTSGIAAALIDLGANPGDRIFEATIAGLKQDFFWTAFNKMAIANNGVVNAASYQPGSGFAPGSYITIAGTGLSAATSAFNTNYLPVALAGTSASFTAGGISVPGHLSYVSPAQINVQVPWELQGQTSASLKVAISGVEEVPVTIPIVSTSPAFFEFADGKGSLMAAALDQNYQLITVANPVQRGTIVQLFVNGLGAVSNQPGSGQVALASPLSQTQETPLVKIGGQNVAVQFSGLAPGIVGLYQVNVIVPLGIAGGPQSVTLSIAGNTSKATTLVVK